MKYVVTGNYGAKNLGDEMILQGMIEMLKKADASAEIDVLEGDEKFPAGFSSTAKWIFGGGKSTKEKVKNCDYFILGGGGLFGGLSQYANIIWWSQAMHAYRYKKPVLMLGQSVGKIKNKYIRKLVKNIFNKSELISVRDTKSKENLKEMGVTKKIVIVPDLAFASEKHGGGQQLSLSGMEADFVPSKDVIISLRQMKNLSESFKIQIARFVQWLTEEEKMNVKFVNFQTGKVDNDEILHDEIKKIIGDNSTEIISPKSTQEAIKLFENAHFALCMRLHSIITAMQTNTPFTAINYAEKIENFMDYMGAKENLLDIKNLSFESLKNLYKKTENTKEKLKHLKKNSKEKIEEFISLYLRKFPKKKDL
ncbi:MAG: polysaccharide pyruvyl transferase family protein [Candidatus Gracilibacteria bacterium]|jgi:polysaccharide pyruvyl transferase CsaB